MMITIITHVFIHDTRQQHIREGKSLINRINWGVVMSESGHIVNGYNKYPFTFQIKIPKLLPVTYREIPCDTEELRSLHCESINLLISKFSNISRQYINEGNAILDAWMQSMPELDNVDIYNRRRKRNSDGTLGPDYCRHIDDPDYTSRRHEGLLSGLSNIWCDLTGTPSFSDIKIIDRHICALSNVTSQNRDRIVELGQEIVDISQIQNDRMNTLESQLMNLNTDINTIYDELRNVTSQEIEDIEIIETRIERLYKATELLIRIEKQLHECESRLQHRRSYIDTFVEGINTLMSGRISPYLIPIDVISTTMNNITERCRLSGNKMILIHDNPSFYYQTKNIAFSKSTTANSLFITVNFPVYSIGGIMRVYRVSKTHLSFTQNHTSSTRIVNLPDYFAVTLDHSHFSELSVSQYASCKGTNTIKMCQFQHSLQDFNQLTCIAALFRDQAIDVMNLCDLRFENKPMPAGATYLGNYTYLVHSNKVNEGNVWSIDCPLRDDIVTHTIKPCSTCIISMKCGCKLIAPEDFIIPMQISDCQLLDDGEIIPGTQVHYPINLAVVHSFFPEHNLGELNGDTFHTKFHDPPKLPIPESLSGKYEKEWNQSVEMDSLYDNSLSKMSQLVRNKSEFFYTRASSQLHEALRFTDLKVNHVKDLTDHLTNLHWLGGLTKTHTVMGVSLVYILLVSSMIMLLYMCVRDCKRQ